METLKTIDPKWVLVAIGFALLIGGKKPCCDSCAQKSVTTTPNQTLKRCATDGGV